MLNKKKVLSLIAATSFIFSFGSTTAFAATSYGDQLPSSLSEQKNEFTPEEAGFTQEEIDKAISEGFVFLPEEGCYAKSGNQTPVLGSTRSMFEQYYVDEEIRQYARGPYPPNIQVSKYVQGKYQSGVWYTRGNCIDWEGKSRTYVYTRTYAIRSYNNGTWSVTPV